MSARAGDGKAVFVEKLPDPHYGFHVALTVHALPGAAFYGLELRKFGFPETQHVGRQAAEICDFANAEIELVRDDDLGSARRLFHSLLANGHGAVPSSLIPYSRF